ncbi:MAG: sugar-binding domain-containing protein [Betaproteobacteria bacterium]
MAIRFRSCIGARERLPARHASVLRCQGGLRRRPGGHDRRELVIPASDQGRRISLEFDGVFRDSIVWVNGHFMGREASGYSSFR